MTQPQPSRFTRRSLVSVVGLIAVLSAACSDNATEAGVSPFSTSTTIGDAPSVGGLDFASGSQVDLGDGWTIAPCEGGPPLLCAHRDGETGTQAVIELLAVPTSSYPTVRRALDAGNTPAAALAAQATEYHTTVHQVRPAGCGAAYRVVTIGPDEVTVAGQPGVMYHFDGQQDGHLAERDIQFATIRGDTLHIVVTNAVDEGTCMDHGTLAEFTTAELTDIQPRIIQMIAASALP